MKAGIQRALSKLVSYEIPLRCLAAVLAMMTFIGVTWFPRDDLSVWEKFYSFSPTLGLALGAALPNRFMAIVAARICLLIVLVLGVVRSALDVPEDLRLPDGADYPAVVLRAVIALTLILLIVRSFGFRSGGDANAPTAT